MVYEILLLIIKIGIVVGKHANFVFEEFDEF